MSNQTQHNLTVVYIYYDATLRVNQDYRIMKNGLNLIIPPCERGDFLSIFPFTGSQNAVKLVRAPSVTLDGSTNDSDLVTGKVSILRATGINTWVKI